MIEVVVVRHGIAVDRDEWDEDDFDRPLTEKGVERMEKAALGLKKIVGEMNGVVSSPYVRAKQTADILGNTFDCKVEVVEQLGCGRYKECKALLPTQGRYLFVGHEPDLRQFAAEACKISASGIEPLKKGGALSIKKGPADNWAISWIFQPRHLRSIGNSLVKIAA
ncbi:MAG: histidine phosphatase family protein [Bdellovibrionales bacterium]|nr:histidine phosphatase family protein [Bdellovibrionales bacterium]